MRNALKELRKIYVSLSDIFEEFTDQETLDQDLLVFYVSCIRLHKDVVQEELDIIQEVLVLYEVPDNIKTKKMTDEEREKFAYCYYPKSFKDLVQLYMDYPSTDIQIITFYMYNLTLLGSILFAYAGGRRINLESIKAYADFIRRLERYFRMEIPYVLDQEYQSIDLGMTANTKTAQKYLEKDYYYECPEKYEDYEEFVDSSYFFEKDNLEDFINDNTIYDIDDDDLFADEDDEEFDAKDEVQEAIDELNSLIGLQEVKDDVNSLINLIKINKLRKERNLPVNPMSLHLVFSGNPGTGKTTVARLLAKIYGKLGVLSSGHLVEVDRSGLVAGYVGQTALKTQNVIEEAIGGVLFIDEAYALTSRYQNDYGNEAIETILKAMEDRRDEFVVIVAGYPDLMQEFLESNPGLKSRFNKFIYFKDYNSNELLEIFKLQCKNAGLTCDKKVLDYLSQYYDDLVLNKDQNFANAREVRNLVEKAMTRQANRLVLDSYITNQELSTLLLEDVIMK